MVWEHVMQELLIKIPTPSISTSKVLELGFMCDYTGIMIMMNYFLKVSTIPIPIH